jgi:exopolyphosphatase/guanosine-5'-triphosphate,3'-diphosphate pyrophosphatase
MDAAGRLVPRDEALVTTRLGSGLRPGGTLDPSAAARTRDAVVAFAGRARAAGVVATWAFATGAVRRAADGVVFARDLAVAAGVPVAILSGSEEARLAYAAACDLADPAAPLLVVDVGGATTELTLGRGSSVEATASLALGALALTEAHGDGDPPSAAAVGALATAVDAALAGTDLPARARALGAAVVASGGTATALATLDLALPSWSPGRVHGHTLDAPRLAALADELARLPVAARDPAGALDAGRAAILPAGAAVLSRVAAAAGAPRLRVSDRAVRHAYLAERIAARRRAEIPN